MPELFENHHVKGIKSDKPIEILYHESFCNNASIDLICIRFTYIVFQQGRRRDEIKYTHLKETGNRISYRGIFTVCRRFKRDDVVVRIEKMSLQINIGKFLEFSRKLK